MGRNRKEVTSKYESKIGRSDAYVIDIINNKKRFKYSYSVEKYGVEHAKLLSEYMVCQLKKAFEEGDPDPNDIVKINNWFSEMENHYEIYTLCAATKEIKTILVDKDDYPLVSNYYWGLFNSNKKFDNLYAVSTKDGQTTRLAHLVLGTQKKTEKFMIRYKNGNTLDNRKENLLLVPFNPKSANGESLDVPSVYNVGRIIIKDNKFLVNYLENDNWSVMEFDITSYDNMEEALKAAKNFRKEKSNELKSSTTNEVK